MKSRAGGVSVVGSLFTNSLRFMAALLLTNSLMACGNQDFLLQDSNFEEDLSSVRADFKSVSESLTRASGSEGLNACQQKLLNVTSVAVGHFDDIKSEGLGVLGCTEQYYQLNPGLPAMAPACDQLTTYESALTAALASEDCKGMDKKPFDDMIVELKNIALSFNRCQMSVASCFKESFAAKRSADVLRTYLSMAISGTGVYLKQGIFLVSQGEPHALKQLTSQLNKLRILPEISGKVVSSAQKIETTMGAVLKTAGPVAPPKKADLVITKMSHEPEAIKVGDLVTIYLEIKNQGQTDIPANTWLGGTLQIIDDKTTWTWAGLTLAEPLKAGQSIVIRTPEAQRWLASAGAKRIQAYIDDQRKVDEDSETNNDLTTELKVAGDNPKAPFAKVIKLAGPIENRDVGFQVTVPKELQGKSGSLFIAAIVPGIPNNSRYYLNAYGEWIKWDGVAVPPAFIQSGYLQSSYTGMIEVDSDLTKYIDTAVYVGIGLGDKANDEMMSNLRYNFIYRVQP